MRRGWVAMLVVVAMVCGIAPPAGVCAARDADKAHSCCSEAAQMSAGCCGTAYESKAVAPAAERDVAVSAADGVRAEIAVPSAEGSRAATGLVSNPPGVKPPIIVLRT